jgi:putative hydrolase of the HAD superfamily
MIELVLFDWTNTLVEFTWDDELLEAGHREALAAIGRTDDPDAFTRRYRELVLAPGARERAYPELLHELLGDADVDRFIDVEHEAWRPAHQVLSSAQALLGSLHARGLRTGLVANSWPDPARLLRADADAYGLAAELDVQIWSEEVGARKPQPEIFLRALDVLAVDATAAMFVGDGLETDVQGAADVGMTTVQALWFRADDTPGIEPDFMAFSPMDVLNAARRIND